MDPVLSGSLCFLVLAIVMYVKFIREYPWSDEELHDSHKTSPVEPDTVPFLHPSSPAGVMQKQKQAKQQHHQQQNKSSHHGLAVLQKAHQYKNMQGGGATGNAAHYPGFLNKQPMRRRTHSATVSSNVAAMSAVGPQGAVVVDGGDAGGVDQQLPTTIFEDHQEDHRRPHLHHRYPPSSGRGQHRINFDNIDFDSDSEMGFLSPRRGSDAANDSLDSVPFEDHDDSGFFDLESSVSPPNGHDMDDLDDSSYPPPSPSTRPSRLSFNDEPQYRLSDLAMGDTPSKLDATKSAIERQFVRTVAQPAQMQLEVARKARIPLFLHSPMYVKTSTPPIVDEVLAPPRLDHFGGAELPDGNANDGYGTLPPLNLHEPGAVQPGQPGQVDGVIAGGMTPRRRDKLPAKCATANNSSLHIDFSELKVAELIGQGAFGTVHRASWRGTTVAVKILVCQYLTTDILEEFETEVQIMSILRYARGAASDGWISVIVMYLFMNALCCVRIAGTRIFVC